MNEHSASVNGISIYSLTNPNLRSFCLSLYVRAGSIFEDLSNNGISHLFEHVVFRNIKNKYENFYELLAMHGLCFQGSTYKKFVSFTIDGPQHEFDFAIEILCGLFDEIKLTSHDFNNEKGRIKAEIREKDRRSSLDFYFDSIVWKNSEVEKIVLGYCKTVDRVSVKKINEFRQKVLSAGNCFVYATGNISDENLDALNKKISKLDICQSNPGFTNTVTVNDEFFHREKKIWIKNNYWHYIQIGFDVDCSKYPGGVYDLLYALLFNGDKALVYNYLSEDNPIIYSYDSAFAQYDNVGNINFSFEVDRNKIEDVFKTVVELLNAAKDGRFNFEANLNYEMFNWELDLDKPSNLNWNMAYYNHILKTEPIDYSDEFYGRFRVIKKQVTDAAKDIFRRCNMTVAMEGDKKKINTDAIEKILEPLD